MNSKFIEKAKESKKIKSLDEAFKDYPVEEEIHKGDPNYFLSEETIIYVKEYEVGDIVFVEKFFYPNKRIGYNHLFVIVDKENSMVPIEYFGYLISSKIEKSKYLNNELLKKDNLNHLKYDSIVKTDAIYQLSYDRICFKIGVVDKEKIELYKN